MSKKNGKSWADGQVTKEEAKETLGLPAPVPRKSGAELFAKAQEAKDEPESIESPAVSLKDPVPLPEPKLTVAGARVAPVAEIVTHEEKEVCCPGKIDKVVAEHLNVLASHEWLSVPEFRMYSSSGGNAANLLQGYAKVGLVEEGWKSTKTVFKLTPLGRQRLDEYVKSKGK